MGTGIDRSHLGLEPEASSIVETEFRRAIEQVPAVLASVTWDESAVTVRDDLVQWLITKGSFHHYRGGSNSYDRTVMVWQYQYDWTFSADQTATYEAEEYFGTSTTNFSPTGAWNGYNTASSSGEVPNFTGTFTVIDDGTDQYILMQWPSGNSSFHSLQINGDELMIDGRSETQ